MSASRLLVLGAVRQHGRAHGYQVRNDLEYWGAHEWSNAKPGSIYHALKQLTKAGSLTEDTLATRTEYEITAHGEQEFQRLLRNALRRPEHRPDMLGAGLALLPALPRQDAIALLCQRLTALQAERDDACAQLRKSHGPEHVGELYTLWGQSAQSGADWTRGLLSRLEAGDYVMAGEPGNHFGEPPARLAE